MSHLAEIFVLTEHFAILLHNLCRHIFYTNGLV